MTRRDLGPCSPTKEKKLLSRFLFLTNTKLLGVDSFFFSKERKIDLPFFFLPLSNGVIENRTVCIFLGYAAIVCKLKVV